MYNLQTTIKIDRILKNFTHQSQLKIKIKIVEIDVRKTLYFKLAIFLSHRWSLLM